MSNGTPSSRTLNDLDRKIVAALQLDGRASWATIAELSGTTGPTAARRVQQLTQDGAVTVAVMKGVGADRLHEFHSLRLQCGPGMAIKVAAKVAERADIRFVALITGQYDVMAEAQIPRQAEAYHSLVREIQMIPGVETVSGELTLHVYKVSHDWARELLGLAPAGSEPVSEEHEAAHFDEVDEAIFQRLTVDARVGFSEMAEAVGLNESTVRRRFERLVSRRWLHVATLVQAAALGFESEVQLRIDVEPARLTEVAHELGRRPQVRYLALPLGANGLVAEVIARRTEDLYSFITAELAELPGVMGWTASLELLTLKRGFVVTPWWRAEVAHIEAGAEPEEPAATR
ncbi:Lrp/AsnC family transcriptional regulator [Georgenia faecalis]|uniref:Lrp/AsnC family transcriptional regulator n=1 Tax=Georgenia faecalis TaxID=2483799 RepID=A0ABV9DAH1_9MICO|nr:Lrp/AsnC family transcriptional regulator [Georgenia faecalis]